MSEASCPKLYETETIRNWKALTDWYSSQKKRFSGWMFRGQERSQWDLKPSLERAICRFEKQWSDVSGIERGLIRRFKRQIHQFPNDAPSKKLPLMECLALMQHHGAPTRLLDWTYSFFVAVYFAFESVQPGGLCAVWALDHDWARDTARAQFPEDVQSLIKKNTLAERDETIRGILQHEPPLSIVYPMNPLRLNQRLVLQQGIFLAPCNIAKPFMKNLEALNVAGDVETHFLKLQILVDEPFLQ